jgi:phenylpropionate dioxygenase-like ring-hydroxylating dioxygenase large terminal subunit
MADAMFPLHEDDDTWRRVRQPLERAWTLPPHAYTDPAVFRAEAQAIFAVDWLCVARLDQLAAPGDFVCVDLLDQPIVVVRALDGELRALSRVCLHRAMPIAEGQGTARRFVCPYHNWTYELDGRLRSAPMMDGAVDFEPRHCRLPELRLEVWQGFVFVSRDPDAQSLKSRLSGLTALLSGCELEPLVIAGTVEFDSPWNWKILVENFMEAYHHIGTHRTTLEPAFPARGSIVEDNGGEPWALLRMPARSAHPADDDPAGDGNGPDHALLAVCVFPTLLFAVSGQTVFWYQVEPTSHDRLRLRIHVLMPRGVRDGLDDDDRAALIQQVRGIHLEDIQANDGTWRGLHADLTRQGRLSPFERAIWQINQLWLDRMSRRADRP